MEKKCRKAVQFLAFVATIYVAFGFVSCSAVFEGGASGKVVDAESTETPKAGIQDV